MAGTKPVVRTLDTDAQLRALVDHAEQTDRISLLNGQLVTATWSAGATSLHIRHSLGRAYLGAVIVGAGAVGDWTVLTPRAAIAMGVNVATHCVLVATAPGANTTLNAWVF